MQLIKAKLSSKYKVTIPKEVRNTLHLSSHDQIVYEITEDNQVILHKSTSFDFEYLSALEATLTEWQSRDDDDA